MSFENSLARDPSVQMKYCLAVWAINYAGGGAGLVEPGVVPGLFYAFWGVGQRVGVLGCGA